MYRCTECYAEYDEFPEYCDCGNDTFEEVYGADSEYSESYSRPSSRKKRQLSPEELEEMEELKAERNKSLIAFGICAVIALLTFLMPPQLKPKSEKALEKAQVANVKLPRVDSYWDNTVASPYRKQDPNWNLPILNNNFGRISPVLRDYLKVIGGDFIRLWDSHSVDGYGECKVEFTINREGRFNNKKISVRSHNESLDDSVLLLLDKITQFDIPPDDYKGERIVISFKIDKNGTSKVYYPTK